MQHPWKYKPEFKVTAATYLAALVVSSTAVYLAALVVSLAVVYMLALVVSLAALYVAAIVVSLYAVHLFISFSRHLFSKSSVQPLYI